MSLARDDHRALVERVSTCTRSRRAGRRDRVVAMLTLQDVIGVDTGVVVHLVTELAAGGTRDAKKRGDAALDRFVGHLDERALDFLRAAGWRPQRRLDLRQRLDRADPRP